MEDADANSSTTSHSQSEQSVVSTVVSTLEVEEDEETELVAAEAAAARVVSQASTAHTLLNGFVSDAATSTLMAARDKDLTPPPTEAQIERMQASEGEGGLEAIPNTECSTNRREAFVVTA